MIQPTPRQRAKSCQFFKPQYPNRVTGLKFLFICAPFQRHHLSDAVIGPRSAAGKFNISYHIAASPWRSRSPALYVRRCRRAGSHGLTPHKHTCNSSDFSCTLPLPNSRQHTVLSGPTDRIALWLITGMLQCDDWPGGGRERSPEYVHVPSAA